MKRINFENLTELQKKSVQVLFVSSDSDVAYDIYLSLANKDMLLGCKTSLLALGYYGVSFFVKDSIGEYSINVTL